MKKIIALLLTLSLCALMLFGCGPADDGAKINIGVLAGPTGMGMAKLMSDTPADSSDYAFRLFQSPNDATAGLSNGELDMLCLPTNAAATLANKKSDYISVLAVNTLGVLYLLSDANTNIHSVKELEGKTVHVSVPSSTTKPILEYLLDKNGVNATIVTETDHKELVKKIATGEASIAVLPEPAVTQALGKNPAYSVDLNLTTEWSKVSASPLAMGCIVARKDFIEAHPGAVHRFMNDYKASVSFMADESNKDTAVELILEEKILESTAAAVKASLENLYGSLVFQEGEEMKTTLKGFYDALLEVAPQYVGGKQPEDDLYYAR